MKKFLLTLVLSAFSLAAVAQIKGTVIDGTNGEPFPGVSVVLKGSSTVTITADNGEFSIAAKPGDVLVFSFMGYKTLERMVNNAEIINVTLEEDTQLMDEIVVVGYGTQKKSDVTGSVASFNTKRLEERPNVNIVQSLQGAVAGLNISMTGSNAEGSSSTTRIRGNNSISASNKPLIVMDGIPFSGSWSEINSNDVESIEILKDASSAAIYGARGANGVILIQTKKGKGEKVSVSYNGYYAFTKAINIPDMMDGETFYQRKLEGDGDFTATELEMYEKGEYTDWLDLALRNGSKMQHNLSLRGAGKTTKYYFSANVSNNKGIAINDDFNKYQLRLNLEQSLGKWVKFGTSTSYGYYDRSGNEINFSNAYLMNPLSSPYQSDGSIRLKTWEDNNYSSNPLSALNEINSDITRSFITNNYIEVTFPIEGLSYKLNTGYTYQTKLAQNYEGLDTVDGLSANGKLSIANTYSEDWLIENIISYNRAFGKHNLFLTGLFSAQSEDVVANSISASGFPNDVMTYWQPNKAATTETKASRVTKTHVSQMLRANYSYDSRYLFTVTARRDGYSAFGEDKKYGIFPSVAVGWNIMNEKFFENSAAADVINNLKFRVSWGKNGNEAISAYATLPVLNSKNYLTDDYSAIFGFYPSTLSSPLLGWETSTSLNIGVDYGFLNDRIKGSIEYYTTQTTDLLLNRTIPSINGTSSIMENIGKTKGNGVEFQISSVNISGKNFTWNTDFNIVHNTTKIVDVGLYDENGKPIDDLASEWFIGHPVDVNYDYIFDGIHQVGETLGYTSPISQPGYVKYVNTNDDDIIDSEDKRVIGSKIPKFTFGMNNTFAYKNLSLSVFLNGQVGATFANYLMDTHSVSYRRNQLNKEFWTEDNPINTYPANVGDASVNPQRVSFYEKNNYLRIKDVSLAYKFPERITSKLKMSRLEVYCNAKNLYTWTTWSGLDPEFVSSGSVQRAIPQTLELLFGLRIDF